MQVRDGCGARSKVAWGNAQANTTVKTNLQSSLPYEVSFTLLVPLYLKKQHRGRLGKKGIKRPRAQGGRGAKAVSSAYCLGWDKHSSWFSRARGCWEGSTESEDRAPCLHAFSPISCINAAQMGSEATCMDPDLPSQNLSLPCTAAQRQR